MCRLSVRPSARDPAQISSLFGVEIFPLVSAHLDEDCLTRPETRLLPVMGSRERTRPPSSTGCRDFNFARTSRAVRALRQVCDASKLRCSCKCSAETRGASSRGVVSHSGRRASSPTRAY